MTDQATPAEEVAALRPQPKGFGVIKAAFRERRTLAMLLLGLGLDEFSMSSQSILQIKKMIRSVNLKDAKKLAEKVLGMSTGQEVEELSRNKLEELVPKLFARDRS